MSLVPFWTGISSTLTVNTPKSSVPSKRPHVSIFFFVFLAAHLRNEDTTDGGRLSVCKFLGQDGFVGFGEGEGDRVAGRGWDGGGSRRGGR